MTSLLKRSIVAGLLLLTTSGLLTACTQPYELTADEASGYVVEKTYREPYTERVGGKYPSTRQVPMEFGLIYETQTGEQLYVAVDVEIWSDIEVGDPIAVE